MRASKFEFEQRFWIFGFIFLIGFQLYWIDHTNFAVALLQTAVPAINLKSSHADHLLRGIFGIGTLLVMGAAMLRTWATAYLRAQVVHDMRQHSDRVVADGPYRYTRNPLYFANLFLAAGIGTMASRAGWVFFVIAMWVFDFRLILREEFGLEQEQRDAYRAYKSRVPRLLPSLRARVPESGADPQWAQAFAAESMFWFFGLAILAFTITLNVKISGIVFALSLVVYFAAIAALRKKPSSGLSR